jgi:predicted nucleic acid-binding protein
MPDKIFLDTNILLYAKVDDGGGKHTKCRGLLAVVLVGSEIVVSAQVLNEYWTCSITRLVVSQVLQNAPHFAFFKRLLFRN